MSVVCKLCKTDDVNVGYTSTNYISVNGLNSEVSVCLKCANNKLRCRKHKTLHVIFIDDTHTCAECVEVAARKAFKRNPAKVISDCKQIVDVVTDLDEFLRLVRVATIDTTLAEELCWLCALYARRDGLGLKSISEVIKDVKKHIQTSRSLVAALLPQSPVNAHP